MSLSEMIILIALIPVFWIVYLCSYKALRISGIIQSFSCAILAMSVSGLGIIGLFRIFCQSEKQVVQDNNAGLIDGILILYATLALTMLIILLLLLFRRCFHFDDKRKAKRFLSRITEEMLTAIKKKRKEFFKKDKRKN